MSTCALLAALSPFNATCGESVTPETFRTASRAKWEEHERLVSRFQKRSTATVDQELGTQKEWLRQTSVLRHRAGCLLWSVELTDSGRDKPLISTCCLNRRHAFEVRKNSVERDWFLHRVSASGLSRQETQGVILGLPSEYEVRAMVLPGLCLNSAFGAKLLPEILDDPAVSFSADRLDAEIVVRFHYNPGKVRTLQDPFTSGEVHLDAQSYLIRSYAAAIDVPGQARVAYQSELAYDQVAGVPVVSRIDQTFRGYDYSNKANISGTRRNVFEYQDEVPNEREFTLEAFALGDVGLAIAPEVEAPPSAPRYHWIFILVGAGFLAAALFAFRRGRQAA